MTAIELYKNLKEKIKVTDRHSYRYSGDRNDKPYNEGIVTLDLWSIPYPLSEYFTKNMWDKIGFNYEKQIYKETVSEYSYGLNSKYQSIYKNEIEKAKLEARIQFIEHIEKNKDKILKLFEKRLKQLEQNKINKEQRQKERSKQLSDSSKILNKLDYVVSKSFSSSHHGISVNERKVPDKYHKYINTEKYTNIKFASVEVKVLKSGYKLGCKIETKGQIGCSFEELTEVYKLIEKEYTVLNKELK